MLVKIGRAQPAGVEGAAMRYRRAWPGGRQTLALLLWLLAGAIAIGLWQGGSFSLTPRIALLNGSDAARGMALVSAGLTPGATMTRVACTGVPVPSGLAVDDPAPDGAIPAVAAIVASVGECYDARWRAGATGVGDDASPDSGFELLLPPDLEVSTALQRAHRDVATDLREIAADDLVRGERIGVPIAFTVLLLATGSLIASLVPFVVAGAAVLVAVGVLLIVSLLTPVSLYAVNVTVMIGLALGIDYTLLCVMRYRDERRAGWGPADARARSLATAGHAVLVSGIVVVVSLGGLLLMPMSVFRDVGIGAMAVVALAVAAVLTLHPMLARALDLRLIGQPALLRWRRPAGPARAWPAFGRLVTSHAAAVIVLVALLLGPLIWLASQMEGQLSSPQLVLPAAVDVDPRSAYLEQELRATALSIVEIVIDGEADPDAIDALLASLGRDVDLAPVVAVETSDAAPFTVVSALVVHPPGSPEAGRAIAWLRGEVVPGVFGDAGGEVLVAGPLALHHDVLATVRQWQPRIIGLICATSLVLLALTLRSIVVALLAVVSTGMSVAAAVGVLVLIVQRGHGAVWFGFDTVPAIEVWVPIVLFCIMFGLGTDYHLFLVSRIRERRREGYPLAESIRFGVGVTGGLVSAAALIMVAVFGAFATGRLAMMQQIGFGLAVAVLIDAFLVRLVFVPACMTLLAPWIWPATAMRRRPAS